LIIASKLNQETFKAAFKKKGLNDNPSLMEASLAQRLAFGSRITTIPIRRAFGRQQQQQEVLIPDVVNKEILISGDIERITRATGGTNPLPATTGAIPYSGMVVAQGNKANGYGLYMADNKLFFVINENGKPYQLTTTTALPAKFSFKAALQKDGTMRLAIDNKEVGSMKTAGLFKKDVEVPLRVGIDPRRGDEKIADYPDTLFNLRANLANGRLETLEGIIPPGQAPKADKVIILQVLKDVMKYDKSLLTAKAGTVLQIVLRNPDFMQHNFVLIKPKTVDKVGEAADRLARGQAQASMGPRMQYVPKMPEVLFATPMINPNGRYTLTFKVPDTPGDYPYLCTFPGHWRIMRGILRVTK
jgi:azurin